MFALLIIIVSAAAAAQEISSCRNLQPILCRDDMHAVCGLTKQGTTVDFQNACQACSDSNVISYASGGCSQARHLLQALFRREISPTNIPTPSASISSEDPISRLGTLAVQAPTKTASPAETLSQVPTQCSHFKISDCGEDHLPVCAELLTGVKVSYLNPCEACSNSQTVHFTNGACTAQNSNQPPSISALERSTFSSPAGIRRLLATTTPATNAPLPSTKALDPMAEILSKIPFPCQAPARAPTCVSDGMAVCGETADGQERPYTSLCAACQDPAIVIYKRSQCSFETATAPPPTSTVISSIKTTTGGSAAPGAGSTSTAPPTPVSPQPPASPLTTLANQFGGFSSTGDDGSFDSAGPAPTPPRSANQTSANKSSSLPPVAPVTVPPPPQNLTPPPVPVSSNNVVSMTPIPKQSASPSIISCDTLRIGPCVSDNMPVCGRSITGKYSNYGNSCIACIDPTIVDFTRVICPDSSLLGASNTSTPTMTPATATNVKLPETAPNPPNFVPFPMTPSTTVQQANKTVAPTSPAPSLSPSPSPNPPPSPSPNPFPTLTPTLTPNPSPIPPSNPPPVTPQPNPQTFTQINNQVVNISSTSVSMSPTPAPQLNLPTVPQTNSNNNINPPPTPQKQPTPAPAPAPVVQPAPIKPPPQPIIIPQLTPITPISPVPQAGQVTISTPTPPKQQTAVVVPVVFSVPQSMTPVQPAPPTLNPTSPPAFAPNGMTWPVSPAVTPFSTPVVAPAPSTATVLNPTTKPANPSPSFLTTQPPFQNAQPSPVSTPPSANDLIMVSQPSAPNLASMLCIPAYRTSCTIDNQPVCARAINNTYVNYSDGCLGCRNHHEFVSYTKGPCVNTMMSRAAALALSQQPLVNFSPSPAPSMMPLPSNTPPIECTPEFRMKCVNNANTVCAMAKSNYTSNFPNSCSACSDPSILYFHQGSCRDGLVWPPIQPIMAATISNIDQTNTYKANRMFCQQAERSPDTCIRSNRIVCAYSEEAPRTFMDICDACLQPGVKAYVPGACEYPPVPLSVKALTFMNCIVPRRPVYTCNLQPSPVCGLSYNGTVTTYLNPCLACSNTSIIKYAGSSCDSTTISPRDIIMGTGPS